MGRAVRHKHPLSSLSLYIFLLATITLCHGEANADPGPASNFPSHLPLVNMPNLQILEGPKDEYYGKNQPATLNCHAEGDPKPDISWYHNDQKVVFNNNNYNENLRMILSNGQLFFLQMVHNKNRTYSGTYYCEASNIHGTVKSRTATIKIAVIKDDFRKEPMDTIESLDGVAILQCDPPRGEPEPEVQWIHNGVQVVQDNRIEIDKGNLVIQRVRKEDSGEYVCVAQNVAGERKSPPIQLTILEIPKIEKYPVDVVAEEGVSVDFTCSATGDGTVRMSWRREGGDVTNQRRWRILPDHTLRIDNVESTDDGLYVCTAENAAGEAEAVARLSIEFTPKILQRPHNQAVAVGRTVNLPCSAEGNPEPTIYWESQNLEDVMFKNRLYRDGRMSVAEDGTLRIERTQKSDEGQYTCQAFSSKGKAEAMVMLTVTENDLRPPPVIRFGPNNQTLPPDSVALLRCQATGNPEPVIRWYRNNHVLQMNDPRYTKLDSGTLQISSLKLNDSGKYTCKAGSETGETTVEAILTVDSHATRTDSLKAQPDLTLYPAAPKKPVVSDVTDTSVRLTWQLLHISGSAQLTHYQVEYFAYESSKTWQVSGNAYTDEDVIIGGLDADTTYVFLVRACNEHGIGGPSPLSDIIRTLEKGEGVAVAPSVSMPVQEIEARLHKVEIRIRQVKAVNSSALRVSWMVNNEYGVVTSYKILYKHILNMGEATRLRYGSIMSKHVGYRPLSSLIAGLESYEFYEICVMAVSGDRLSACSAPMRMQSGESVPTMPPVNIDVQRVSDSEVLVSWNAPDMEHRKGEITAYQVKCFSTDRQHNCSLLTNGTTHKVKIDNLVPGVNYNIEVAAATKKGVGKWSTPHSIGPTDSGITKEPWFIGLIIAIGVTLWLGLCIFTVWLCKSRKRRKKLKEQWYTGGQASEKQQDRNGSIVRKCFNKKDGGFQDSTVQGSPAELSTLLQQSQHESDENNEALCGHPEMKTFYTGSGPVTPYATTALLQAQAHAQRKGGPDQMFRPIIQHSGGSADSNTDRSNTTDENGFLLKQNRHPGYRPGVSQNPGTVNWSDVLPPPPNHPPHDRDCIHDDQLYSEIPEDRARSPKSPAQLSACSCPVSRTQATPTYNPSSYSDNCNRCQTLRNYDNRPYSPQQMLQIHRQQGLPPNMAQTLGAHPNMNIQRGRGTPVYMHGYQQPWDSQPLPRGPTEYDYAQVPREDGYNYTQPIKDALIQHSNTPNMRSVVSARGQADPQGHYAGQHCHPMNIPGGPPGNYCEGPCRSHVDTLNSINSCCHGNMGENSQLPYLEGYKIESPPSSGTEYRMCNSAGSHSGSGAESVRPNTGFTGRSVSEGNDLKDRQVYSGYGMNCRPLHHSRSETAECAPGHGIIEDGYSRNADSHMMDECDYTEDEHPDDVHSQRDSMVANWESMEDCSDIHSSSNNEADEADGQFLNEEDFASAVARAAELSGLTVVGTTVTDPNPKQGKKTRRHHRQVRPPSPGYSTDSNYGTADIPHKPYPKSQRRRQMADNGVDAAKCPVTQTPSPSHLAQTASSGPAHLSSQAVPSLYRNRSPTDTIPTDPLQPNNTRPKIPIFQFTDDIPVV